MTKPTLYLSFDIEADGPHPYKSSMLSFGLVALDKDKNEIARFSRNLLPKISDRPDPRTMAEFWDKPEQKVAWDAMKTDRIQPATFVRELLELYSSLQPKWHLVWVAYPAAYDWMFLAHYYHLYKLDTDPDIGYSAKCISTLLGLYLKRFSEEERDDVKAELAEGAPHTHLAVDDAYEQGIIWCNLLREFDLKCIEDLGTVFVGANAVHSSS